MMDYHGTIRFLIHDGAGQFISGFDEVFHSQGTTIIRTPPRTPVANAYAERWVGTVRRELCDRTLIWNRQHLARLLQRLRRALQHPSTSPVTRPTRTQPPGRRRSIGPASRSDDTPPATDSSTNTTKQPEPPDNGQPIQTSSASTRPPPRRRSDINTDWYHRNPERDSGTDKIGATQQRPMGSRWFVDETCAQGNQAAPTSNRGGSSGGGRAVTRPSISLKRSR